MAPVFLSEQGGIVKTLLLSMDDYIEICWFL